MSFLPLQLVKGVECVMFRCDYGFLQRLCSNKQITANIYSQAMKVFVGNVPKRNIFLLFNSNNAMDDFCKVHVLGESVYQRQEKQLFRLRLAALRVTVEHQTRKTNKKPQTKTTTKK